MVAGVKNKNGFTLIELMIIAIIIGILVMIGTMAYTSSLRKSRDSRRKKDLRSFVDALQMYMGDHGEYPPAGPGTIGWRGYIQGPLNTCGDTSFYDGIEYYMDIVPSDPQSRQGKEYYYHKISETEYCLVSELERTDDAGYIAGDHDDVFNTFGGCDTDSGCGNMQTPHYVVTNP